MKVGSNVESHLADSQASLEAGPSSLEEMEKEKGKAMTTYKLHDKEITEEQLNNPAYGYTEEEKIRIRLTPVINQIQDDQIPGPTWDTKKLQEEFEVQGFAAPFVMVKRKSDGVQGSMMFRHDPRVYFNFKPA